MKNTLWFLSYFLSSIVAFSGHVDEEVELSDFNDIMFDIDLDLLRQKQAADALGMAADKITNFGWRFLGYDSHTFVIAKSTLNNDDLRIELILALLAVEKYPSQDDASMAFRWLMQEIESGKLSENFKEFETGIYSLSVSSRFPEIYNNIKGLSASERLAIVDNVLERESFIGDASRYAQLREGQLACIEKCLKPMLNNYSDDGENY